MPSIYLKNKGYLVENLPSEPSLLVELLELCRNDNANFEMFSTAICKDAALTAKILQVANSPAYRQWNEINDIRRMLIVLGLTNVRNIVTTCAVQQFFAKFTRQFSKNVQLTWLRSILCANLAERLAHLVGYKKPGEAFLAGLLHQIGMLLLLLNREEEYLPLLERFYDNDSEQFRQLEQDTLQIDHCELGAALIESWNLDSFIADAIHFQQAPPEDLSSSPTLLKILAVAAPLSSRNSAADNQIYRQRAGLLFDMTEATILDCLELARDKSRQMVTDLGFSGRFYQEGNEEQLFAEEQLHEKTDKLGEEIKNITLSSTIGRSETAELLAFTKEIRASFSSIFNLDRMFLFRTNAERTLLTPVNDLNINQLDEIEFTLDDSRSLLVEAYSQRRPLTSFESSGGSIADRQILRLLGTEGVCYLPLPHGGVNAGALAIGLSEKEWPRLQQRMPLLSLLCREIARKYSSDHSGQKPAGMPMVDFRKLAHEVSNPLTIINNYLYTLGKKIDAEHPAQEEIKFINEEIERAGSILLRAKDPKAAGQRKEERININQLIEDLDKLLQNSLYKTHKVSATLALDPTLPSLYCPDDKLKQVLLNLIKNAAEALAEGGRIEISTRNNFYQNGRPYIAITIRDDGPGMAPEILNNLFQAVESTKEGHAGLGLAIVNNLVAEMNGHIACQSSSDQGTEFTVLLPRKLKQTYADAD